MCIVSSCTCGLCRYFDLQIQGEATSSRSSEIRLMPMPDLEEISSSVAEKERSSPPPILRRRKNALHQRTETPDSGNQSDYLIITQQQHHHQHQQQAGDATPSTPIKQLPFSPSQFLNSLSPETSSWPRASTPKGSSPGPLTTPQPTGLRRSQNGKLPTLLYSCSIPSLIINWPCGQCRSPIKARTMFRSVENNRSLEIKCKCNCRWQHAEDANAVQERARGAGAA